MNKYLYCILLTVYSNFSNSQNNVMYDFENLISGFYTNYLHGQDGWHVSSSLTYYQYSNNFSCPSQDNIRDPFIAHSTYFNNVINSKHIYMHAGYSDQKAVLSRKDNSSWHLPPLDNAKYLILELDVEMENTPLSSFHLAYDKNNDGNFGYNCGSIDPDETSIGFSFTDIIPNPSYSNYDSNTKLYGAEGQIIADTTVDGTYNFLQSFTDRIRIMLIIDFLANNKEGSISVFYRLYDSVWIKMASMQNLNPGFDLLSTGRSNPNNLNGMYITYSAKTENNPITCLYDNIRLTTLGKDTIEICEGETVTIGKSISSASYSWSTGATTPHIDVSNEGTYYVDIKLLNDEYANWFDGYPGYNASTHLPSKPTIRDTIVVLKTKLELENDTNICQGDSITIYAPNGMDSYLWSDDIIDDSDVPSSNFNDYNLVPAGWSGASSADITYSGNQLDGLGGNTAITINGSSTNGAKVLQIDLGSQVVTAPCIISFWVKRNSGSHSVLNVRSNEWDFTLPLNNTWKRVSTVVNSGTFTGTNFAIGWGQTNIGEISISVYGLQVDEGVSANSLIVNQQGTYYLTVSKNGCYSSDTITINELTNPQLAINDTSYCEGDSITIYAPYGMDSYLWSDGANADSLLVKQAGIYHLTITKNGCSSSDTILVSEKSNPELSINDTSYCQGDSITIYAPNGMDSYVWNDGSDADSLLVKQAGIYHLTITKNGCSSNDAFTVNDISNIKLTMNDTSICQGGSITLYAPSGIDSYLWSDGSSADSLFVNQAGVYSLNVSLDGCSSNDTILVSERNNPQLAINDTSYCEGDSITIYAPYGMDSYLWSDGSVANSLLVSQAGIYHLIITKKGCVSKDTVSIRRIDNPELIPMNDTIICENTNLIIRVDAVFEEYIWNDGSSNNHLSVDSSGDYYLTTKIHGCELKSDTIRVKKILLPRVIKPMKDTLICNDSPILLEAHINNSDQLLWNDLSSETTNLIQNSGEYWVRGSNLCGSVTDRVNVINKDCSCEVFLVNTFTPNKDQLNDEFEIQLECIPSSYELKIYNRWGELIFISQDYQEKWDGYYQGKISPTGIYPYKLFIQFENDTKRIINQKLFLKN